MTSVPTLDFNLPVTGLEHWTNLVSTLRNALLNEGYVYVINHGIRPEIISIPCEKTREFFTLPIEIKKKYLKSSEIIGYHGYNSKWGRDEVNDDPVLLRERFDFWPHQKNKEQFYPVEDIPGFDTAILDLVNSQPMRNLIRILLSLLSWILKFSKIKEFRSKIKSVLILESYFLLKECPDGEKWKDLESFHRGIIKDKSPVDNYSYFSAKFYPRIQSGTELNSGRCSTRIDNSTFTMLFLDDAGGIQKKTPAGDWEDIPTLKNGILLTTGHFVEAISNGKIPALVHRFSPDCAQSVERQNLSLYILPDSETQFTPLNSSVSTKFGEYYEKVLNIRRND